MALLQYLLSESKQTCFYLSLNNRETQSKRFHTKKLVYSYLDGTSLAPEVQLYKSNLLDNR